ncbi:DUF4268 domain-containing protein [Nitrobacter hamburgensis]|uniref:DUF4268 domain-containing protein n=1 Tax=Nitrobacter hamburgensis TaxID=912 RepID=UPI003D31F588
MAEEKEKSHARFVERLKFWEGLLEFASKKTQLHAGRSPTKDNLIGGPTDITGINLNYVVLEHEARVEIWIGRGSGRAAENEDIFKRLFDQRQAIEHAPSAADRPKPRRRSTFSHR